MNFRSTYCSLIGVLAVTFVSFPSLAQDGGELSLAEALTAGQAKLAFRYRYEHVDEDGFAENANASTLRMRLNYQTGKWKNWSGFTEFDYVGEVLVNDFNNLSGSSGDRDQYPVVADAKGTDLNQLYLDYDPSEEAKLRLGRQRILLDNQRFVGGVGWRQNEQTFDSASFRYKGITNTEFFYSYVTTVRRIFGAEVTGGRHDNDTHLLNAKIKLSDSWSVTPYYYLIDNKDFDSFSTSTFGARLAGGIPVGEGKLNFIVEAATQSDAGDNPVSYDAEYFNLGATWAMKNGLSLGLNWESLGGDQNTPGSAFRTPLATLHLFQGWADRFIVTPNAGVDDLFATVKYKAGKWNFAGVYHDFTAQSGSADWGTEFDLSAGRKLGDRYGLLLKAALYDAKQHRADTNIFWIMLTASY
jgi:hypothetical protein